MPGFEVITGQEHPVGILTTLFQNRVVPHALLFTGVEGVGKQTCAMKFSMLCNCLQYNQTAGNDSAKRADYGRINPCGKCRPCLKIESGNHPDIITLKPAGASLKIEQIRSLGGMIALKPYEATTRMVIISDAHRMTPGAANALLKSLEEPPARTVFILTANHISGLIPTVVSRCRHIRFNPIPLKNITEMLSAKLVLDPESSRIIASLAAGSFTKALEMGSNKKVNWLKQRMWLIDAAIQGCLAGEDPTAAAEPYELIFARAEKLSRDKDLLSDSLEIIKTWLRDVAVYKYSPDKVINIDMLKSIKAAAEKITVKSIISKVKSIHEAQKHIQTNANLRMTMEILMLRLVGVDTL